VHEIEFDANNKINKLAVDFIDYCHEKHHGAIRYNSSYPLARSEPYAVAGSDQKVFENSQAILNGTHSDSGSDIVNGNLDKIVSYKWDQLAGTPVLISDSNFAVTTIVTPTVNSGTETLTFQLTVTDEEGLTDTDKVDVIVQSTDIVRTFMTVNDFKAKSILFTDDHSPFQFSYNGTDFFDVHINGNSSLLGRFVTDDNSDVGAGSFSYLPVDPYEFPNTTVISLGVGGSGCNRSYGVIDIFDFSSTLSNDITKLEMDYIHYCEPSSLTNDLSTTGRLIFNKVADGEVPVADAGNDIILFEGETIFLDGTGSVDVDGEVIGYHWRQLTGQLQGIRFREGMMAGVIAEITARPLPLGIDEVDLIFELTVFDIDGFTSSDIVSVKVLRTNQAPIVKDDDITIIQNEITDINVRVNDNDPDGLIERFIFGNEPLHGRRVFTGDDSIRYIPDEGYTGSDSLTYAVIDDFGAYSEFATVDITVMQPPDELPVTQDDGVTLSDKGVNVSGGIISPYFLSFLVIIFYMFGIKRVRPL
jgi:hypothetical protein